MNERELKSSLMKKLRASFPRYVAFRHEDRLSSGHPDISITGNKITIWIECKYGASQFAHKGIQDLTMLRLSQEGYAFHLVWIQQNDGHRYTYIVNPKDIGKSRDTWVPVRLGFDHDFVIQTLTGLFNNGNKE